MWAAAQRPAKPTVIGLVAIHVGVCQPLAINRNISKHWASTLFDELVAAFGAGDADFAAPTGHAQLLTALGAAVVVVVLALLEPHLILAQPGRYAVLVG